MAAEEEGERSTQSAAGAMASVRERAWSWLLDTVGKRPPVVISHTAVARIAPRVAQKIRV
ncbi:hypothetical protein C3L29_001345 [Pseudomonas sp. MWU12-2534b]|nr:hypothetical protein C3L29_001345 [Pseudomonas sp. MWU12-2534b]